MSYVSKNDVLERIRGATKSSPVAVFKRDKELFEVIFASTVEGAKRILSDETLIGVFYGYNGEVEFLCKTPNIYCSE